MPQITASTFTFQITKPKLQHTHDRHTYVFSENLQVTNLQVVERNTLQSPGLQGVHSCDQLSHHHAKEPHHGHPEEQCIMMQLVQQEHSTAHMLQQPLYMCHASQPTRQVGWHPLHCHAGSTR